MFVNPEEVKELPQQYREKLPESWAREQTQKLHFENQQKIPRSHCTLQEERFRHNLKLWTT
jgi:hypothetical protein